MNKVPRRFCRRSCRGPSSGKLQSLDAAQSHRQWPQMHGSCRLGNRLPSIVVMSKAVSPEKRSVLKDLGVARTGTYGYGG